MHNSDFRMQKSRMQDADTTRGFSPAGVGELTDLHDCVPLRRLFESPTLAAFARAVEAAMAAGEAVPPIGRA